MSSRSGARRSASRCARAACPPNASRTACSSRSAPSAAIELNYLPRLSRCSRTPGRRTRCRLRRRRRTIASCWQTWRAQVFRHGRFHQDPRIDPRLGDRRYRAWMRNAFERSTQRVLKCLLDGAAVGFFVVEAPQPGHCFWSLTGLAPGLQGRGLGKRVWQAMLRHHQGEGVHTVSTSISSHNVPVFNLYVALGFRFPAPSVTLQWCPPGGWADASMSTLRQLVSFGMIGIASNAALYVVYLVMTELGVGHKAAMTAVLRSACSSTYAFNRRLTFRHEGAIATIGSALRRRLSARLLGEHRGAGAARRRRGFPASGGHAGLDRGDSRARVRVAEILGFRG